MIPILVFCGTFPQSLDFFSELQSHLLFNSSIWVPKMQLKTNTGKREERVLCFANKPVSPQISLFSEWHYYLSSAQADSLGVIIYFTLSSCQGVGMFSEQGQLDSLPGLWTLSRWCKVRKLATADSSQLRQPISSCHLESQSCLWPSPSWDLLLQALLLIIM